MTSPRQTIDLPEIQYLRPDDHRAAIPAPARGAHDTVALKFIELPPHYRAADAGCRLDDAIFVEVVPSVMKEVVQNERIDEERVAMRRPSVPWNLSC